MDDERERLERFLAEARSRLDDLSRLRSLNLHENIDYSESESGLENLDSSVKKNSAFVKKLKCYNESQSSYILDEVDRLNSTKFISEIVSSLVEAKLKLSDIPSVIEICTKLNRIYKDFRALLLNEFKKCLPSIRKRANQNEGQNRSVTSQVTISQYSLAQISAVASNRSRANNQLYEVVPSNLNASKLKLDLRLFSELILAGILPLKDSFQLLIGCLCYLMVAEGNTYQNGQILLTFLKGSSVEFLGLVPSEISELASKHHMDIPRCDYISDKRKIIVRTYTKEYYRLLLKSLSEVQEELKDLLAKQRRISQSRGDITKELRDLIETKGSDSRKMLSMIVQFSEILNETPPDPAGVAELDDEKNQSSDIQLESAKSKHGDENPSDGQNSPLTTVWDDDGALSFYEDLIDLKKLFPNLKTKTTLRQTVLEEPVDQSRSTTDIDKPDPLLKDPSNPKSSPDRGEEDSSSTRSKSSSSDNEESVDKLSVKRSVADRVQPEQYFNRLSHCVNRDMIDDAAIDFIKFFNTKFGRKKLTKTIFNVQRTRLDLLPFYARLVATIYPYVPSIGMDLASQLKSELRYLFKKKDQINIESKVKNVRFIGEFVKFNLISRQEVIDILKTLLTDFTHHHIEMACNLLETCGRLLYKSTDSHHQLKIILEQVMRKKLYLSVDSKYVTMIENAYYLTNPPEVVKEVVSETPIEQYIRYLLYEFLDRSTIDKVLKKLELLDWNDKQVAKFVINRMVEAYNVKYYNIRYFAALLSSLNKKHAWISMAVVDGVVEDIQLMMEINEIQFNQRRVPMIRYFGELFNYRLTDSSLIFKILYSLISYGVNYHSPDQTLSQIPASHVDPPENLFRIKLVCDLLDISGPYLNSSQDRKKLDCYLLFFQRYYWCKRHIFMLHPYCMVKYGGQFPVSTEYLYHDTILNLRSSFTFASSYSQAVEYLKNFMADLAEKDEE